MRKENAPVHKILLHVFYFLLHTDAGFTQRSIFIEDKVQYHLHPLCSSEASLASLYACNSVQIRLKSFETQLNTTQTDVLDLHELVHA